MLIQSSFPCSIEAAPFYISDHGNEDVLCDRMPSAETWQVYLKCKDYHFDWRRKAEPMQDDRRNADDPCSSNFPSSLDWPSTVSTMTENTIPSIVYRRKKPRKNSTAPIVKPEPVNVPRSSCAHLSSADDQPAVSEVKHEIGTIKDPVATTALYDRGPFFSIRDSKSQCLLGEYGDGATKNILKKNLVINSVNDSCSTSKSNLDLASDSIETERNETGECSSSSVIAVDVMREGQSEKDFCINILRSYGLLGGGFPSDNGASQGDAITADDSCCRRSCKICGQFAGSLKMLICDNCEEAYHPSCWNPRWKKKLPLDEWFCHSCLIKKRKILSETITRSSPGMNSEMGGTILPMLKDTEPYTTKVRIGKGFQAEVPDWSGPVRSDYGDVAEPSEIDCSEFSILKDENFRKPTSHSSIGNWLQCQEVLDRSNGTICGKWRRAPIFEVQTDDWECFCAIHWDPTHADCAAPQEMETDQVLKQLKYIEMLRPRLTKRKSEYTKRSE